MGGLGFLLVSSRLLFEHADDGVDHTGQRHLRARSTGIDDLQQGRVNPVGNADVAHDLRLIPWFFAVSSRLLPVPSSRTRMSCEAQCSP